MERITNLIRGLVTVEVKGAFPENFLNQCARINLEFWNAKPVDDFSITLTLRNRDLKRAEAIARRTLCTMEIISRRGGADTVRTLGKRRVLIAGAVCCLIALGMSSLFIWEIEVTGNESVSSVEILRGLDECGVGIGSFWPTFTTDSIRSEALLKLPELSWLTVNVYGSRAEVKVRERTPKPEIVDEKLPTNVVAEKSGLITDMNVLRGTPLLGEGYTVLKGDVIVSGAVGSTFAGTAAEHAMAEITARTWYDLTAAAPLTENIKIFTGDKSSRVSLLLGNKRINFYHNSGTDGHNYDKIERAGRMGINGVFALPVEIVVETGGEYEITRAPADPETVRATLETSLEKYLRDEIGESGKIVSSAYSASEKDDYLYVTLHAECVEEIWELQPMTEDELRRIEAENAG